MKKKSRSISWLRILLLLVLGLCNRYKRSCFRNVSANAEDAYSPVQKIEELLEEFRGNIIFASTGRSSAVDADRMIISVHKSYSDYVRFREYLRTEWEGLVLVGSSFLMSLKSDKVIRPLSTRYLFENLGK